MARAQPYTPADQPGNEPRDDLDVAYSIIRSSEFNDLLNQINFGTGYYEDEELRMQMRNVRKGLVTDIAFSKTLRDHAEQETKVKLADEGFRYFDQAAEQIREWRPLGELDDGSKWQEKLDEHGRTAVLLERGEDIWKDLAHPQYSLSVEQAAALDAKTGMSAFKPIFYHLAATYHEQTKSKGARTQDNYFGRVRRQVLQGDADDEDTRKFLIGRRGSS